MPLEHPRRLSASVSLALVALLAGAACWSQTQVMRAPGYYLPPATSKAPAAKGAHGSSRGANLLDLNTATLDQLKALPGMGVVFSQRVIAGRPYHAKNQLVRRGILPAEEYARIRELVVAHRATAETAHTGR